MSAQAWSVGRLLETPQTKVMAPELRASLDEAEKCAVFANFSAEDRGESRRLVAQFRDPAEAMLGAAAPDLLAALKDLVTEIRAYSSPECDDDGNIGAAELKAADAAIAKAEGRS